MDYVTFHVVRNEKIYNKKEKLYALVATIYKIPQDTNN